MVMIRYFNAIFGYAMNKSRHDGRISRKEKFVDNEYEDKNLPLNVTL